MCVCVLFAAILPRHVAGNKKGSVVKLLTGFRNYLAYHLKCSKSYFHSRMRLRVVKLQKVNFYLGSTLV